MIEVELPPLRERREDMPLLVAHFVEKYGSELGREVQRVTDAALDKLVAYDYPGNVRELENVIERAVALSRGGEIDVAVLPPTVVRTRSAAGRERLPAEGVSLETVLADFERGLLLEALEQCGGVKKRAAQRLGISFRSFRYRLEKLGLEEPGDEAEPSRRPSGLAAACCDGRRHGLPLRLARLWTAGGRSATGRLRDRSRAQRAQRSGASGIRHACHVRDLRQPGGRGSPAADGLSSRRVTAPATANIIARQGNVGCAASR